MWAKGNRAWIEYGPRLCQAIRRTHDDSLQRSRKRERPCGYIFRKPRLPPKKDDSAVAGPRDVPRGQETILVVEDNPAVRETAADTLRSLGYIVLEAADGNEALAIAKGDKKIDILFTDVIMPGGMTGPTVARELRAQRPWAARVLLHVRIHRECLRSSRQVGRRRGASPKALPAAGIGAENTGRPRSLDGCCFGHAHRRSIWAARKSRP